MRRSAFAWPMSGSTAERWRSSRLIVSVTRRLRPGDKDPELVAERGVVAAMATVGDDAGKARAYLRLDLRDHGRECVWPGARVRSAAAGRRSRIPRQTPGMFPAALGRAPAPADDPDFSSLRPCALAGLLSWPSSCPQPPVTMP